MYNDISDTTVPRGPIDLEEIKDLWKFRISRHEAEQWAARDMRFLVFDDTDLRERGYDSDDEEGMLRYALQMSMEEGQSESDGATEPRDPSTVAESNRESNVEGGMCALSLNHSAASTAGDGEEEDTLSDGSESDVELQRAIAISIGLEAGLETEHGGIQAEEEEGNGYVEPEPEPCHTCQNLPEFPHDRKTTKFRLYTPSKDPSIDTSHPCAHYVAVSYCWPEPVLDEQGNMVRMDGTYQIREPDGLGGTRVRKTRALDDVLERAVDFANSFGLRMIWIDQECLPQPTEDSPQEDKDYHQIGVQAMDIVYNRAVATAGLHAGEIARQSQLDAVYELMEVDLEETTPSQFDYGRGLFDEVSSFLDMVSCDRWYTRSWVVQESVSAGKQLALVFRRGSAVFDTRDGNLRRGPSVHKIQHSLDTEERKMPSGLIIILVNDFRRIVQAAAHLLGSYFVDLRPTLLRAARDLHPTVIASNRTHQVFSHNVYGSRQVLDGAGALTLLKTRQCRDSQDHIAILANMCGYEIRLDSSQVAKRCKSLRVGLLSLMLLNGDLSALVPEVYPSLISGSSGTDVIVRDGDLLTAPFDLHTEEINHSRIRPGNMIVPRPSKHTNQWYQRPDALPLSAYMWSVEGEIDLSPIKHQWAEDWHSIKCLEIEVDRIEGESTVAFNLRLESIAKHIGRDEIMQMAHDEIRRAGGGPLHLDVNSALLKNFIQHQIWARDRPDPGVHITATLLAGTVENTPFLRDLVARIIFDILRYLFALSSTDPRAFGAANSIWQSVRVDSIHAMSDELPDLVGDELFTSPHVLNDAFATLSLHADSRGSYRQLWFVDRIMRDGTLWVGRYIRAPPRWQPPPESDEDDDHLRAMKEDARRNTAKTIIGRQMIVQLAMTLFKAGAIGGGQGDGDSGNSQRVYNLFLLARGGLEAEADVQRARELVSVFDVDGPCTVATPFVSDWEVLPRPEIRNMSVCWVVQPVMGPDQDPEKRKVEETSDAEGVGADFSTVCASGEDVGTGNDEDIDTEPTYRVVGKVRGLWQLIELLPWQEYWFR